MFILRRVTSEYNQINQIIGDSYNLVIKDMHKHEFDRTCQINQCDSDNVFGFVVYNDGSRIYRLYKKSTYLMYTSTGDLFENLSNYNN